MVGRYRICQAFSLFIEKIAIYENRVILKDNKKSGCQ